jgi:hypothetical protein
MTLLLKMILLLDKLNVLAIIGLEYGGGIK